MNESKFIDLLFYISSVVIGIWIVYLMASITVTQEETERTSPLVKILKEWKEADVG